MFIDVFIGVWAFVLAWCGRTASRSAGREGAGSGDLGAVPEVRLRLFPDVRGHAVLALRSADPDPATGLNDGAGNRRSVPHACFSCMTFFTIGLAANFRRLWAEGIGRLALVYVVSLFGFIIWIGLVISWLFFSGFKPPIVGG